MYPGTHAQIWPDKPAIVVEETGAVTTYAELDDRSRRLAWVFRTMGLRRGDHVAFLSDNAPEVFEVYWAALRSGLFVTGINYRLSAEEAAYILDDCGARAIVASAHVGELASHASSLAPRLERRLAFGGDIEGFDSYEEALASAPDAPLPDQPRGADMLYSSGTTGRPKGVKPSLLNQQVDEPGDPFGAVFGPLYGFGPDTVYYSCAPTYHAAPLRFGGMVHMFGGTLLMGRKFDAERSLAAVDRHRVTHSQWVPTMFVRMLKLDDDVRDRYDVSSMQVAIHAAAPCPVDVKQAMIDWWGPILQEYYASTEANGITLINSEQWLTKRGSVGKAGLGVIRICDDGGSEVPAGEIGTVYFEREIVPFEYHNAPDKTREAQHPAHPTWTTTGDIGYVDEDGFLFLTDRKAFMIISGGVNIYPQEIENCLALHPKVLDIAVLGIPDPEMGEQVKAVVQAAPGVETGPAWRPARSWSASSSSSCASGWRTTRRRGASTSVRNSRGMPPASWSRACSATTTPAGDVTQSNTRTGLMTVPFSEASTASLIFSKGKVWMSFSNGNTPSRYRSRSRGMKACGSASPSMTPLSRRPRSR